MKEVGVQVKRRKKYKVMIDSNQQQPLFDNLLSRQFNVEQANKANVGDITYRVPGVQH